MISLGLLPLSSRGQLQGNRFSLREVSSLPRMVLHHLLDVFDPFLLETFFLFIFLLIATVSLFNLIGFIVTYFNSFPFLMRSSVLYEVNLLAQFGLLLIVRQLLLGSAHVYLKSLLPHLLVVGQLLCQMVPFESFQVLQVPSIVSELVVTFLAADQRVIKGHCRHFCVFLELELNPAFNVPHLAISSTFFPLSRDVLVLRLEVNTTNLKSLGEQLAQVV